MSDTPTLAEIWAQHGLSEPTPPIKSQRMSENLTMRECLLRDINDLRRERDEARRLLAAAQESLNAIHVEVGPH